MLVTCAGLASLVAEPARAGWAAASPTRHKLAPAAASALVNGDVVLWSSGPLVRRLVWPPGASEPRLSALPAFAGTDELNVWPSTPRGDVLMIDEDEALLVDAGGAAAPVTATVPATDEFEQMAGAIGADGTAAIAWTAEQGDGTDEDTTAWVRIRTPGSQFGPLLTLTAPGPIRQVAIDVGADGEVEVLYAYWDGRRHVLVHTDIAAGAIVGPSISVASTSAGMPFFMKLLAGGPGLGRVLFAASDTGPQSYRASALLRTSATAWGARQTLEPGSAIDEDSDVRRLPGGGALLAYSTFDRVSVRQAPPGGPFGPSQHLGQAPHGWLASDPVAAVNARGDLLVAWSEFTDNALCGEEFCFDRVRAAAAVVGRPFGPARVLSPLGIQLDSLVVAALSEQGRRLVAWQTNDVASAAPATLWAAQGKTSADTEARADRRAPRVLLAASTQALREAVRSGRLRMSVHADQACAVRVWVEGASDDEGSQDTLDDLRIVALRKAGTRRVSWSLTAPERAIVRRALDRGQLDVRAIATDTAGNLRRLHALAG